jgi:hypothetical protein
VSQGSFWEPLAQVQPAVPFSSVSKNASSLPLPTASRGERGRLVRRARVLSSLSVGWMTVEAGVAIIAALVAGSVALFGFGLDSLIELASASIVIWRFTETRSQSEAAERRAQQLIAVCFAALALYLLYDGIRTLTDGSTTSWLGVAVSIGAVIVMPLLARAKNRVAAQLDSAATAGDAAQAWLCDRGGGCAREHPRQRRARLVVAGSDHRSRHRRPRYARGPRGVGG